RLPPFLFWLLKELVKANIDVARIVLSRRMPIEPTVITLDAQDLSPLGQTVVANSIGLTPGSVVTDINRGMIEVHCLTRAAAADVCSRELVRGVRRMSGSESRVLRRSIDHTGCYAGRFRAGCLLVALVLRF